MTNKEYNQQIEGLYFLMHDRLLIYAKCAMESEAQAEEAVQETFRIACAKPEALCGSPNPQGWLMQTLKYVISNVKKNKEASRKLLMEYLVSNSHNITMNSDEIRLEVLYENVAEMDEFKLIKSVAVDGKSYLELARELGISVDACKKRVQRSKEKLKMILKK